MTTELEIGLYIFILAGFLGYHVISGISLGGSLVVAGADFGMLSTFLGFIAVACSSTNVVGGFLITDRMLKMFKKGEDGRGGGGGRGRRGRRGGVVILVAGPPGGVF